MLFKSFFIFFSLGNAAKILEGGRTRILTASDEPTDPPQVNGTITSVKVLGGTGCPSGSYHIGPFQPGKSLNAYVEFDAGTYFYNSSSIAPVDCALDVSYEFIHPEGGAALVVFDSITYYTNEYEEGDDEKMTEFVTRYDINATAGDDSIDGPMDIINTIANTGNYTVAAGLFPNGEPGQLDFGTFQMTVSMYTEFGPGIMSISRIELGFGIRQD